MGQGAAPADEAGWIAPALGRGAKPTVSILTLTPDPSFPPSAPGAAFAQTRRRPERAARTASVSGGCGHQHRRRLRQKEPERR